jgi:negative regulator of flagellin synthesis FlgM
MKVPGESFVSSKINGLEPRPTRVTPGSAVRPLPGATTGAGSEKPASGDDVVLTSAARKLAAAEESVRNMPVVDELRVAAIRQRLQDGSYEIDPQRIADRLLRMEDDLARARPFDSPLK